MTASPPVSECCQPGTRVTPLLVALVGNPNVGKSVVFKYLTGRHVVISNYPGTTVEVCTGPSRVPGPGGRPMEVVDTPGVNGLIPNSEDEQVTRNLLLERRPDIVLQVADAKNLHRALLITSQIGELGLPAVLQLNLWDEARARGVRLDRRGLARRLGIPVVATVATERRGMRAVVRALSRASRPRLEVPFGAGLERALAEIEALFAPLGEGRRGLALMFLAGDAEIEARLAQQLGAEVIARARNIREAEARHHAEPLRYVIARCRHEYAGALCRQFERLEARGVAGSAVGRLALYGLLPLIGGAAGYVLGRLVAEAARLIGLGGAWSAWGSWLFAASLFALYLAHLVRAQRLRPGTVTEHLGWLMLHPLLAPPLVLLILWGMYKVVGEFGAGTCVDFLEDKVFGSAAPGEGGVGEPSGGFYLGRWHVRFQGLNYYLGHLLRRWIPPEHLIYRLLLGRDAGLIQVGLTYSLAIVLPVVTLFFGCFALLEDSGLLPRLAAMLDRLFKRAGLSGKAVLPMVLGLGCDTMATLTTRILETRRERIIATLLLALAVPCSAQLGVIAGALGSVSGAALAIYIGVILAVFVLVGSAASWVLPGERGDFIMEIPPIRRPQLRNVLAKTAYRVQWFATEAVPLFLGGTLLMFILGETGVLAALERLARPVVVGVLGLPAQATRGFILGFLRRDYAAVDILKHPESISPAQVLVAMVVITLFVPCVAQFFVMVKERGLKVALLIVAFVVPVAVLVGAVVRGVLALLPPGALAP